jgi:hypothetical protein
MMHQMKGRIQLHWPGSPKASTGVPEVLGKATMRRIEIAKPNENQEAKAAERRAANERYSPPLHATVTEGPEEPVGGSKKRGRGTGRSGQKVHVTYHCQMWPYH